jgi:carbamoyl-phosphate synthase small subunit
VDEASLDGTGFVADQINVNDGTVEGVCHKNLPIFTSQYHPEASPGPTDTAFLFDKFAKMIKEAKQ